MSRSKHERITERFQISMLKKFEYVWEMNGRQLTGTKNAADEETLRRHIQEIGGKLISVISMSEVPEAEAVVISEIVTPAVHLEQEALLRELKRWNWGAFGLTWIWGIGNRTWISFLTLFPLMQIPMMILLGVKGNAWAWEKGDWRDLNHFRDAQRRWAKAAGFAAVFSVIGLLSLFLLFSNFIKKSEPYQVSLALAKNDADVQKNLGLPLKEGFFVWGKSSYSREGKFVNIAYSLSGAKDRGMVYVKASKKSRDWNYDFVYVDLGKKRQRINKTPGSLVQDHSKRGPGTAGVTKEDALKIATRICAVHGWMAGFTDVEITEDPVNGVWHVRTNVSAHDQGASIDIDKKSGEVLKAEWGTA